MTRSLWLRGEFDEIRRLVEEYLRSLGRNAQPKRVGRLYIYRVGMFSRIILAPYSDGTTYIRMPEKYGELLSRLAPYTHKEPPRSRDAADRILDLIIERQQLLGKTRTSRLGLTLSATLAATGLALTAIGISAPGLLLLAVGCITVFLPIGARWFWVRGGSIAVPILYPRYKARLEEVTREIKTLAATLPAREREKIEILDAYPRDQQPV